MGSIIKQLNVALTTVSKIRINRLARMLRLRKYRSMILKDYTEAPSARVVVDHAYAKVDNS